MRKAKLIERHSTFLWHQLILKIDNWKNLKTSIYPAFLVWSVFRETNFFDIESIVVEVLLWNLMVQISFKIIQYFALSFFFQECFKLWAALLSHPAITKPDLNFLIFLPFLYA